MCEVHSERPIKVQISIAYANNIGVSTRLIHFI